MERSDKNLKFALYSIIFLGITWVYLHFVAENGSSSIVKYLGYEILNDARIESKNGNMIYLLPAMILYLPACIACMLFRKKEWLKELSAAPMTIMLTLLLGVLVVEAVHSWQRFPGTIHNFIPVSNTILLFAVGMIDALTIIGMRKPIFQSKEKNNEQKTAVDKKEERNIDY